MRDPLVLQRALRRIAEQRIQEAMERGAFDNLPGMGRPIPDLDQPYEPDWWIKKWLLRERIAEHQRGADPRLRKLAAVEELREPPLIGG